MSEEDKQLEFLQDWEARNKPRDMELRKLLAEQLTPIQSKVLLILNQIECAERDYIDARQLKMHFSYLNDIGEPVLEV